MIFSIVDPSDGDPSHDTALYGKNGVAWVLRFGGICTLVSELCDVSWTCDS